MLRRKTRTADILVALIGCTIGFIGAFLWQQGMPVPTGDLLAAGEAGTAYLNAHPYITATMILGLVIYIVGLARLARSKNRSVWWATSAILSFLGLGIVLLLKERK